MDNKFHHTANLTDVERTVVGNVYFHHSRNNAVARTESYLMLCFMLIDLLIVDAHNNHIYATIVVELNDRIISDGSFFRN